MNNTDQRILSFYALDVEILSEPNQDIRNHLEEMVLGTPGKLQYRFFEVKDKLSWLKNGKFLILKKSGRIIGSVCLIRRESPILSKGYPFWYIRYMFIRAPLKPKSYKQKKKKRDPAIHLSYLWSSVLKYFEQPEILIDSSDLTRQSLFYKDQYYVYIEDNEIVAGMQANKKAWKFLNQPGISGFILLKVLPLVPVISRYWKPRNFRFTAIEGLFYKDGHENKLIDLMESVCAINQTHFIFYWTDPSSRIYNIISQPGVRGFMSRFFPSEDIDICAKFNNWKQEDIDNFIQRPAYISCFDST